MRSNPGSEYYRQRFRLPKGVWGYGFLFFWGVGFGSAVFVGPLAIALIFGLIGWGAALLSLVGFCKEVVPQRRAIELDPEGLTETFWLRPPRRYAWSDIEDVGRARQGGWVTAHGQRIDVDDNLLGWPRLLRHVEQGVLDASEAEVAGAVVSVAELRQWLGVEPGQQLSSRGTPPWAALALIPAWLLVTGALVAFYAPFVAAILRGPADTRLGELVFTLAHASIFFSLFSGGLLVKILRGLRGALAQHVVADETGLAVAGPLGWHTYGWAEVQGLHSTDTHWVVITEDGDIPLPGAGPPLDRLVEALHRVITARQAGRLLPALGAVPAGALSQVRETGANEATRGLSQVEVQR